MTALRVRGPSQPLSGDVSVPGDKSIGHRSVMFAAIGDGPAEVSGLSGGEDNLRTISVLRALGVTIDERGPGAARVAGAGLDGLRGAAVALDCGNSGTSIRLFSGLLCGRQFESRLVGDEYLHARPMRRVADPLTRMGGRVEGSPGRKPEEIYPPLLVGGVKTRVHGIRHASAVASAQVKTAVLLAGLGAEGATTVVEPELSRDHTERMLGAMGAPIRREDEGRTIVLDPTGWDRRLAPRDWVVPGDLSSAAFLLGAATLVPGSRLVVRGVGLNPTRTGVLDALLAMGGDLTVENAREVGGEPVGDLVCRHTALRGIEISGALTVRAIDELPLLAALAAHADGITTIRDAAELRVKESDRISATCAMLRALGVSVEEHQDGLTVSGRPGTARAGTVDSHGDHRIAMAGAICALAAPGETLIRDTDNIATSFPTFERLLTQLGAPLA